MRIKVNDGEFSCVLKNIDSTPNYDLEPEKGQKKNVKILLE